MSKKLYEETNIQDIADAIRAKNGTQNQYTVAQMGNAVRAITTQPNLETLNVTENGNYLPSAGKDGFSSVSVSVSGAASVIQPLSATQNGTYNPPSGVDGFAPVTVNVSGGSSGLEGVYLPEIDSSYATLESGSSIVVHGHHAEMVLRLNFTNKSTGAIGSIPSGIRPAGVAYFRLGNGGSTAVGYGRVTPDGEIRITSSGFGGNYAYAHAEWDIPEQSYELLILDPNIVRSVLGKIAKIGNICTLRCRTTISSSNDGWKNNIVAIPEAIRPDEAIVGTFYSDPYDVNGMSPQIKDVVYDPETGSFRIWLPSGTNTGTFMAVWQIGSA